MIPVRPTRLSTARMYARVLAGDAEWNGRFFTGVLTTGIYCLPSCKARKPKLENVRFFPNCEEARQAGLRPCKKCHPDDFARGADPVLDSVEMLVGEVRSNPAAFIDARSVVRRSGFGLTRLSELVRQHYHSTPADLLLRARLELAKRQLLASDAPLTEIAFGTGFESLSTFHDNFRRLNGLTPASYRALPASRRFSISLPDGYLLPYLRRALTRDIHSVTEKFVGDTYTFVIPLVDGPALASLTFSGSEVIVELSTAATPQAHAIVVGLLGLDNDTAAFARLVRKLGLTRLVVGREELRISRTPSVYDGLLWSIIGQQINFTFACLLRSRLIRRVSKPIDDGLFTPPTPAAVAALNPTDLIPLQFSKQKSEYVVHTSRLIAEGKLDLAALSSLSATRAQRLLLGVKGLGPWSVNYLMMRAIGFADCVPLGDTGVTSGLQSLLKLEERPDVDATRRLMSVFSPYRSLATAHLWQFTQPPPLP